MNTDTGKVYEGDEIEKAKARGENLVPIGPTAAATIKEGRRLLAEGKRNRRLRAQARAAARKGAKRAKAVRRMQKASRKANR